MSFDRLIEKIIEMKNPTVVGLDPRLEYVPEFIQRRYLDKDGWTLKAAAKAIYDFNQAIIDEIHDVVPAIKPQAAYYEMYGHYGMRTLEKTIRYAVESALLQLTNFHFNVIVVDTHSTDGTTEVLQVRRNSQPKLV
jgi:orotidine-5'-phosphate decarboxylase